MTSSAYYAQFRLPMIFGNVNIQQNFKPVPYSGSFAPALGSSSIGISSRGFRTGSYIDTIEEPQMIIHQQSFADIFNPPCDSNRVIIKLCESMKKEWQ